MEIQLIIVGGRASKKEVTLTLPAVIGRSREADLTIAHPMISRQHCQVFEADGLVMIRDLDSLNGTIVAEERISEAAIRPDGEFTIGPLTFRAKYHYDGDLSAIPAPKPPEAKKGRPRAVLEEDLADSRWEAPAVPSNPQTLEVPEPGRRRGPAVPARNQPPAAEPDDEPGDDLLLPSPEQAAEETSSDQDDMTVQFEEVTEEEQPSAPARSAGRPSKAAAPPSPAGKASKAPGPAKTSPAQPSPSQPAKGGSVDDDDLLKDFLDGLQ